MHTAKEDPEILVIGHVTKDKYEDQYRVGGAAYYGSVTAKKLGKNVCLVTSHADDFKFPKEMFGIDLINVPSPATTTSLFFLTNTIVVIAYKWILNLIVQAQV